MQNIKKNGVQRVTGVGDPAVEPAPPQFRPRLSEQGHLQAQTLHPAL